MANGPEEIRQQAVGLILEYGNPLPGRLTALEDLGRKLEELYQSEIKFRNKYPANYGNDATLRRLALHLMAPGIACEVNAHKPKDADPNETFHSALYKEVLGQARELPLRGVEVPFQRGSIRIWSSNWEVENELGEVMHSAVLGDRQSLPKLTMEECDILFSSSQRNIWIIKPAGEVNIIRGKSEPVVTSYDPRQFDRMLTIADRYLAQPR